MCLRIGVRLRVSTNVLGCECILPSPTCMCMSVPRYVCIWMSAHLRAVCQYTCICRGACVCALESMCANLHMGIYWCVLMHRWLWVCVFGYKYAWSCYVSVCLCIHDWTRVFMSGLVYVVRLWFRGNYEDPLSHILFPTYKKLIQGLVDNEFFFLALFCGEELDARLWLLCRKQCEAQPGFGRLHAEKISLCPPSIPAGSQASS